MEAVEAARQGRTLLLTAGAWARRRPSPAKVSAEPKEEEVPGELASQAQPFHRSLLRSDSHSPLRREKGLSKVYRMFFGANDSVSLGSCLLIVLSGPGSVASEVCERKCQQAFT